MTHEDAILAVIAENPGIHAEQVFFRVGGFGFTETQKALKALRNSERVATRRINVPGRGARLSYFTPAAFAARVEQEETWSGERRRLIEEAERVGAALTKIGEEWRTVGLEPGWVAVRASTLAPMLGIEDAVQS